jgi:hypothetical protein
VLGCPCNFSTNQRIPQNNDFAEFEIRPTDNINESGVALVQDEGVFLGWIRAPYVPVIRPRVEAGEVLAGKLSHIREFYWAQGGGTCYEGQLTLYMAL